MTCRKPPPAVPSWLLESLQVSPLSATAGEDDADAGLAQIAAVGQERGAPERAVRAAEVRTLASSAAANSGSHSGGVGAVKLASFNVENLFLRARAVNGDTLADGSPAWPTRNASTRF
jgi:hypothetical protein